MSERRQNERVSRGFIVRYMFQGSTTWGVSTLRDISVTGCSFGTSEIFQIGELVKIELKLPALKPLSLIGKTVRAEKSEGGSLVYACVEFKALESSAQAVIKEVVDALVKLNKSSH